MEELTSPEAAIDQLLESLSTIESQRTVLGDAIDPVIAGIKTKLEGFLPPEPTETQLQLLASWETVVKTSEELDLPAPEPTEAIAEAMAAADNYTKIKQKIGGISVTSSVENIPVPDETVTPPAEPSTPIAAKPPKKPRTRSKPAGSKTSAYTQPQTPEIMTGEVVISDGTKEFLPKESTRKMYVDILKALAEAKDNKMDITPFLRKIAGASPIELHLAERGQRELDPAIDSKEATRICQQFYKTLGVLKKRNLVLHEAGSDNAHGSGQFKVSKSGTVQLLAPPTFITDGDTLRIEVVPKPFDIRINQYDQTITNGRDKKVEVVKTPEVFANIARGLGVIAVRSEDEHKKFTRANLSKWFEETGEEALSDDALKNLSYDLSIIANDFGGDFPLMRRGVRGGAYFTWESGVPVDVVNEFPEKPRFDDPVYITSTGETIIVTVDGEDHEILSYEKVAALFDEQGRIPGQLVEQYTSYFECLSLLEANEKVSMIDILETIYGSAIDHDELNRMVTRFRSMSAKINEKVDGSLINWQNHAGIVIDINRKVIVRHDLQPATADVVNPDASLPENDIPAPPSPSAEPEQTPGDLTEGPVDPRKTAEQLIEDADRLPENVKKSVQGRLIHVGRYEYPKTLNEAVYLLQVLSSPVVLAEVRENSRFSHSDGSEFQNFLANATFACFVRTMSWGDFSEITNAVRNTSKTGIAAETDAVMRSLERSHQSTIDELGQQSLRNPHEHARNEAYIDSVLDSLIAGNVMTPSNPYQAISLLDIFRKNRAQIAEGKTQAQFQKMVSAMHKHVSDVLGTDNMSTVLRTRNPRNVSKPGKAVLTAGGEERALTRTEKRRFPDSPTHHKRRHRRK